MPFKTYITSLLIIGILLLTHTLTLAAPISTAPTSTAPISAARAPSRNPNPVSNSTAPNPASSNSTEDPFYTCYLSCWEIHYVEPARGLDCIKTCGERNETSPAGTSRAVPSSAPPAAATAAAPFNTMTPHPPPSDINKALVECYHSCHIRTNDQDRFALLNCIYTCRQRQNALPVEPALPSSPPSESKSESQPPRDGPTSPQQKKKKKRAANTDATVRATTNLAESDVDVDVDVNMNEEVPSSPQQCTHICAHPSSSLCITNSPDHRVCMNTCLSHSLQWVLYHCGAAGFASR